MILFKVMPCHQFGAKPLPGQGVLKLRSLILLLRIFLISENYPPNLLNRVHSWHVSPQLNTLRPRQNGRHFADDIFKCIFLNENAWISLKISLKFVTKVQINDIPSLVQIMARRRPGDKPLSEPMMVSLLTHICVTRPQWVNFRNTFQPLKLTL